MKKPVIVSVSAGISVHYLDENGKSRKVESTGMTPSPAFGGVEELLNSLCVTLKETLGLNYAFIPVYDESQVEEVAVGEYALRETN